MNRQKHSIPSLSADAYSYPVTPVAPIALEMVITHTKKPTSLQQVIFVLFSHDVYVAYEQALRTVGWL
jgi:O-acetyl-ADP-ribose deacetylase (regulator of RNase III)